MNRAVVDRVVEAMLYEGYILYPYRSSVKNRQCWTFGGLYPGAYCEAHPGADASTMQTQCLVQGGDDTTLSVTVRFLHLVDRRVGRLDQPLAELPAHGEPPLRFVEVMQIDGALYQEWQEAVERETAVATLKVCNLVNPPRKQAISFPAQITRELLRSSHEGIVGALVREQQPVDGSIEIGAEPVSDGLCRVTAGVSNTSPIDGAPGATRDEALMRSLVSTHTILEVEHGEFVSLMDPPAALREAAADCRNIGTWPVLVGEAGETDTMLSSPIILYDYPQVAPESRGELFDSTEIDELLTLRIMTLTDEEKRAMAAVDARASALLARTETMARQELLGLHGAIRGFGPAENG